MNKLFPILLYSEFILAGIVFILLFFIHAPYGRFLRGGWGPSLPAKWAWFWQELPAFATILTLFLVHDGWTSPIHWVFLLIWQAHYFHRTFIYPFQFGSGAKPYPLLLVLFAVLFNLMNGYINGTYLFSLSDYPANWWTSPQFIAGTVVFFVGFSINKQADRQLRNFKKEAGGKYVIPEGGMFQYVSCPHYLGEILEWTGWAILTWSLPGLAFAVFTFANLAPRAWSHHQWYKTHFANYPVNRKALLPFIW